MGAYPHSAAPPPAILIAWSDRHMAWRATAIVADVDGSAAAAIEGPTTSEGRHAGDALLALLDRRFGLLGDHECAPTIVSIAAEPEPEEANMLWEATR